MAVFTPTTNPMIISASATVIASRPFLAKLVCWVGPTTGGTVASIADLDATPNTIASGVCTTSNTAVTLWPGPARLTLPGKATQTASFQVTVPSGSLFIWF